MVMGTRAHQTALFVVFESPFMMVSDYPGAYEGQPELPFLSAVPASWDETRVLNAKVGDYITIARRHGKDWYVGSIAGSHGVHVGHPARIPGRGRLQSRDLLRRSRRRRSSDEDRRGAKEREPRRRR
jgi:alpha-glucosidase